MEKLDKVMVEQLETLSVWELADECVTWGANRSISKAEKILIEGLIGEMPVADKKNWLLDELGYKEYELRMNGQKEEAE